MKNRPLCIATIFYLIGIIIGLYLQISIAFLIGIAIMFVLIILVLYLKKQSTVNKLTRIYSKNIKKYIIPILILLFGIIYTKIIDTNYENKYNVIREDEVKIIAIVTSEVKEKQYKYTYEVKIIEINNEQYSKYKDTHCLLNVKKSKDKNILKYGDLIQLDGTFEIPNEARNYKGFDYKQYLKTKKISGIINTKEDIKIIKENCANAYEKFLNYIATDMKNRIYQLLPEDVRELCIGILIGERTDISDDINDAFRTSNLTHMLAVSGAHISYIVAGLTILLSKTDKRTSKIFTIIFLIFFMGLTKYTPSVERASIMYIFIIISSLVHRKSDIYNNLAISMFIILLFNPYAILNVGFQLSYGGTIGIVLFYKKISNYLYEKIGIDRHIQKNEVEIHNKKRMLKKVLKYILDMLIITISANLIIIPIIIFHFNTLSLTFWLSNILAGIFIGAITILGFILYIISIISMKMANIFAVLPTILLKILIYIATFCSKLPLSSIIVKTPYIVEIIIYYITIFALFNYSKIKNIYRKSKYIKLIIMTITVIIFTSTIIINTVNKNLKIYFVDVGQGDCTLIYTPTNKTILIDGGGSEKSNSFDVGKQILLPYLLDRRITKIDYMLISHFDSDHIGGLLYVLENIKVKHVIISKQGEMCENYKRFKEIVKNKKNNIIVAKLGEKINIDKYTYLDILFPEEELISENVLNNNSIVAKLHYNNFSMLFTGDIEKTAEEKIIKLYNNELSSTIIKVAHHGSKSSSTQELLNLIKPKIALIGVGAKNTFGHPNNDVINRLEDLGTKVYRTDINGEIILKINPKGKIEIKKKFPNK